MYFIIFVGQLQPSCIIFRYYISCRVQDTIVYNLRHKLDYLCKYVIKLDIRSKQKWIEKKNPFTPKYLWQQEAIWLIVSRVMNKYQSSAVNQIFLCMRCSVFIPLTISFLLKLLYFPFVASELFSFCFCRLNFPSGLLHLKGRKCV